jgi:hypothetical protein
VSRKLKHTASFVALASVLAWAPAVVASTVAGGGGKRTDCMTVFEAPGANKPAPPKTPKRVDCIDGDVSCDADGTRNATCAFEFQVCINATGLLKCVPDSTDSVVVDHAIDDGDPKFDPDFQALQTRIDALGFPDNDSIDLCTVSSAVTVPLRAKSNGKFRTNRKRVRMNAEGGVLDKPFARDRDRIKFTCRPEGDGIYLPTELYASTFERIAQQVFAPSCAISACHDSESGPTSGNLTLLPGAAYSQLVGVVPDNVAAAGAGLLRVTPNDEAASLLYRKLGCDLEAGWGSCMPLTGAAVDPELIEIIRLWILDGAPETGWVPGTDQ